jgi:hypothetical protein
MNRGRRTDGETNPVLRGIFDHDIDYFSGRRSHPQQFTGFELQYQHGEPSAARAGFGVRDGRVNWAMTRVFVAGRVRCCGPKLLSRTAEVPDVLVIFDLSCTALNEDAEFSSIGRTSSSVS